MEKKRVALKKRNDKIAKKEKNLKRIVFVNKNSGSKFMISNKKTLEKIDGAPEEVKTFLSAHLNRVNRASLSSII